MAMELGFWTGMREAQVDRIKNKQIQDTLDKEEKRLEGWFHRWGTRIEEQLTGIPAEGKRATKLRQQREEMEKYLRDREENWRNAHFLAVDEPSTRLVLVVEGVK